MFWNQDIGNPIIMWILKTILLLVLCYCGYGISYKKENLDSFSEWKMMGIRDYVLGLEPGTNYPDGRKYARENNTLKFIKPNETKIFEIKVEMIDNLDKYLSLTKEN